ncbi:MAG: acyl-CoA dehydrogenase family protein [Frankiales bacterium]|nr:acyl-CoA dehydrogenase family protein [Frankiales bacterium]
MSDTVPAPLDPLVADAVSELQEVLDGGHAAVRQLARGALGELDLQLADRLARDDYRDQVLDWCRTLAKSGAGSRSFPREYGGQGDPGGSIAAFQTLGHGDLSLAVKVGVQFGLFGGSIERLGTQRHHDAYLRDLAALDLAGCFAMSEVGHGSDVRSIRTQARFDVQAGEFVLHTPDEDARKDWIGNAARHARLAVVFAQLDVAGQARGVHAFVVPIRSDAGDVLPGVEIEDCGDKMGLQGVDNGRLRFSAVRLPREALLDRYGQVSSEGEYTSAIGSPGARFFTMIGALVQGRISIAGAGLAAGRNALTIAVRWGERRRQFGTGLDMDTPLMDYLTHQRRLLPAIATSYALQALHDHVTSLYVIQLSDPIPARQREVEALAAGLKAVATWHMARSIQDSRECCGGKGYLAENRFATLRADSDVFVTFEGDNTVLLQLVAKTLLSDYAAQFEDLDAVGMVRHLTTRTVSRLVGDSPLGRLTRESTELRSAAWQAEALRFREERLVDSLARRLRRLVKDEHLDPLRALSHVQDHALAAATAHVDRVAHELFSVTVAARADSPAGPALTRLRDLHALAIMSADRAWWLEHGYLDAETSKAVQTEVNVLCAELRPAALGLVEGFGIPDHLLRAPIAVGID